MKRYIVGYAFDCAPNAQLIHDTPRVALIEKQKPSWQAGLFNGVGGKADGGNGDWSEPFPVAMEREFEEETGLFVSRGRWNHFCTVERPGEFQLWYFRAFDVDVCECETVEAERIVKPTVQEAMKLPMLPNALWAMLLALDEKLHGVVEVTY